MAANYAIQPNRLLFFLLLSFLNVFLGIFVTAWSGAQFDYRDGHSRQMLDVLGGAHPWTLDRESLHPPIFFLLAPLLNLHPLSLKFIYCFGNLIIVTFLNWRAIIHYEGHRILRFMTVILINANLYPWFFTYFFGMTDPLMSIFVFLSIFFLLRNKGRFAGLVLALAAGIKVYPGFLFFTFLWDHQKKALRTEFIIAFTAICVFFALLSFYLWGLGTFKFIEHNLLYEAEIATVWRPIELRFALGPTKERALITLGLVGLFYFIGHKFLFERGLSLYSQAFITLSLLLSLFPAGHIQYLATTTFLLPIIVMEQSTSRIRFLSLVFLIGYWIWLQFLIQQYFSNNLSRETLPGLASRDWVGLPHFILTLFICMWIAFKPKDTGSTCAS